VASAPRRPRSLLRVPYARPGHPVPYVLLLSHRHRGAPGPPPGTAGRRGAPRLQAARLRLRLPGVTATVACPGRRRARGTARYLVGCDGVHSRVRTSPASGSPGMPRAALRAATCAWPPRRPDRTPPTPRSSLGRGCAADLPAGRRACGRIVASYRRVRVRRRCPTSSRSWSPGARGLPPGRRGRRRLDLPRAGTCGAAAVRGTGVPGRRRGAHAQPGGR